LTTLLFLLKEGFEIGEEFKKTDLKLGGSASGLEFTIPYFI